MENFNEYTALEGFDTDLYFKALISVAKADGELSEIEKKYILDQGKLLSFDLGDMLNENTVIEDIKIENSASVTKKILIRDCIALANIDNHYEKSEREVIMSIAEKIGLQNEQIDEIENWLNDYWQIMEKAETIFA